MNLTSQLILFPVLAAIPYALVILYERVSKAKKQKDQTRMKALIASVKLQRTMLSLRTFEQFLIFKDWVNEVRKKNPSIETPYHLTRRPYLFMLSEQDQLKAIKATQKIFNTHEPRNGSSLQMSSKDSEFIRMGQKEDEQSNDRSEGLAWNTPGRTEIKGKHA